MRWRTLWGWGAAAHGGAEGARWCGVLRAPLEDCGLLGRMESGLLGRYSVLLGVLACPGRSWEAWALAGVGVGGPCRVESRLKGEASGGVRREPWV